jgi:GH25 family lysozyme M1 (1,4-beta-N-acetylmuramidase)
MAVTFYADASSYQGHPNWAAVKAAGFGGGAAKATQGVDYVSPDWAHDKAALLAEAGPDFVPGAYLYLTAGNGAGQADYFAAHAGSLPGFVIWVDLERAASGASPSVTDARDCVTRLRELYPHNRIGLYAGQSFTGSNYLTFADLLWSPHYVLGSGTPVDVYRNVPGSFWDGYGGMSVTLLQFSQTVMVAGVIGEADCSAFRGSAAEMRAALLGIKPPAPSPATALEDGMILVQPPQAGLPEGVTWPGVFLLDSAGALHHVTASVAGVSNIAAYQAAGIKGPVTITYAEFLERGGTS